MKTGDVVLDGQKNRYQVGLLLGRGLWGKTYRVRRERDQGDFVLKCALKAEDLPTDHPEPAEAEQVCRDILQEQAEYLAEQRYGFLPVLEEHFTTQGGEPVLILQRYPSSLALRLQADASLTERVDILLQAARHCRQITGSPSFHGALHPRNVLLDERGEVILADPCTPTAQRRLRVLLEGGRGSRCYLPPEILRANAAAPFSEGADTYALGMMLWRCIMGDGEKKLPLPTEGLDKAGAVALRDRLYSRLENEHSNPRFHGRLANRLSALVNRAISHKSSPSPPYRFNTVEDLLPRIEEIRALVLPQVETVGRIVLDRAPNDDTFSTGEPIRFTASVGCSPGVEDHEEIACGIAVFDTESEQRLRDLQCRYDVDRHPSGRFRFSFEAEDLRPGRYRVRVAFAIRDSGHEPATREAEIRVQPSEDYVPPREAPPSPALPLEPEQDEPGDTVPASPAPSPGSAPGPDSSPDSRPEPGPEPIPPPEPEDTDEPDTVRTPIPLVQAGAAAASSSAVPEAAPRPSSPGTGARPDPEASPPSVSLGARGAGSEPAPEPAPGPRAADSGPDPSRERDAGDSLPPALADLGGWRDLPPSGGEEDLEDDLDEEPEPVGSLSVRKGWNQLVELVRGDAYVLFMVTAGALIVLLIIAIWSLGR